MPMTPAQCRAARGLLDWSQKTLAAHAGISVATVRNFERGRTTALIPQNESAILIAFARAGVEIIPRGVRAAPPGQDEP